jgi:hypothetical protein
VQPPPYSQPPYPPPAPPAQRGNRALVIGLAAGVLLLLLLAALIVVLVTSHRGTPGKVRGTLQFRKVLATTNGACPAGHPEQLPSVKGDVCYQLGDGMTIIRLKKIELRPPEGGNPSFTVLFTLRPEDAGRLGTLTGEVAREQQPRNALAVVVDGKVASAPQVMEPITGGTIMLSGSFTRAEAQRYVDLVER